ncbi:hypothetical protein PCC7418_2778 [Halothece sp. PCC 7418]|nr:hypothetical protein PCC7418_2778 [Halothece sp. PCC 7418]
MEKLLNPLRLNPTAIVPPWEWINWQPISLQRDRAIWQNYLNSNSWLSQLENKTFPNCKVVIDLDETLLLNSYSSPEIWEIGQGYQDPEIYPAYQYSQMRKTWRGRLKRLRGRTHYDTANQKAYPFLQNPRHIVMFRPGMLAGLAWLGERGIDLILVTASARKRVHYLLKRFPLLTEVFGNRIISAQDMVEYYLHQAPSANQIKDHISREAFEKRPFSLAIKTPDLVNQILGNGGYDWIVDDSAVLAETVRETPLRDRLLWVRSDLPVSNYGMQILTTLVAKLMKEQKQPSPSQDFKPLEPNSQVKEILSYEDNPWVRLEDPYYWPLCHRGDQLSAVLIEQ